MSGLRLTKKRSRSSSSSRSISSRPPCSRSSKSPLQVALEHALQCPGGVSKTLDVLRSASSSDLELLRRSSNNKSCWSPLPAALLWAGSTYTRRVGSRIPRSLGPTLQDLCRVWCTDCGMSIDSGGGTVSEYYYHRPLVLAAYYGMVDLVDTLLREWGATPDLGDGEGRTAWIAALQNPANQPQVFRDCDRQVAELLWQRGCVTADLGTWKRQQNGATKKGGLIYVNGDCRQGSALLMAMGTNQKQLNMKVVDFLLCHGAVLTDRDFLVLWHKRHGRHHLIHTVVKKRWDEYRKGKGGCMMVDSDEIHTALHCWSPETDWSFPPTWKVAVALSSHCGLPKDVFNDYVIPFLSRDWFYQPEQLSNADRIPARMGPSLGREFRNLASRSVRWKDDTC